jgi:hypothetical protein
MRRNNKHEKKEKQQAQKWKATNVKRGINNKCDEEKQ